MRKFIRCTLCFILLLNLIFGLAVTGLAHSGRTDGSGGHRDNKNASGLGSYHYHCGGYPPHLHSGGYCPYTDVFPSAVSVNVGKQTLAKGESVEISAAVYPANSCNTSISWASSDPNVVKVQNGSLVAVGYGTAMITATSFNDKIGKVQITVKEIMPESLSIENQTDHLYIGETQTLEGVITPEVVDNAELTWSSSAPEIAAVSESGELTAIASGSTMISATTANGISTSFTLIVEEKTVESIEIVQEDMKIYLRDEIPLSANISPADATYADVTWNSSNEAILAVDKNGVATALSCGVVSVTATSSNGLTDSIEVEVDEIIAEWIGIVGQSELLIGSEMQMGVDIYPENTTIKDIIWESDNESVLTVDETGLIYAHSVGVATVSAIQKDVQATMKIEVLPISVESVEIRVDMPEKVYVGDTLRFAAEVKPENATYPDVVWNTTQNRVATIDENGVLTARFCGKVVVTATTQEGIEDAYELTVFLPEIVIAASIGTVSCAAAAGMIYQRKKSKKM